MCALIAGGDHFVGWTASRVATCSKGTTAAGAAISTHERAPVQ